MQTSVSLPFIVRALDVRTNTYSEWPRTHKVSATVLASRMVMEGNWRSISIIHNGEQIAVVE